MKRISSLIILLALLFSLALASDVTADRAGNPIALPQSISRVISLAPSTTQILCDMGLKDKLIAVDAYSPLYCELPDDLPLFNMMAPDVELLLSLEPDVIFTTGMSYTEGDPFAMLGRLGVCVAEIPSSESIADVREDIRFIAACMGCPEKGEALLTDMDVVFEAVSAIGATIEDKKTVLFEVAALPDIYSFGRGTFLDEMITLIGAENVLGDRESWLSVAEEQAVASDPDVILTNVDYIEDPVGEILARPGWDAVAAVKNGEVYAIDNAASSIPNHHISDALIQMARCVYPGAYASLDLK